jgi:hypothetical protein
MFGCICYFSDLGTATSCHPFNKWKVNMKSVVEDIVRQVKEAGFEDILDAEDSDIRELCNANCFNLKDIARRLRLNNHSTQLLTAHLAIDHTLSTFLSQQFIPDTAIDVDRWAFAQKVDLLFSMGLFSKKLLTALRKINTLRNKAAHRLDFRVSPDDVDAVIDLCSGPDDKATGRLRFAEALLTALLQLDQARSNDAYQQAMTYRAFLNARRVLGEGRSV